MSTTRRTDRSQGFTLVELLVALLLGGLVIVVAHALFAEVAAAAAAGAAAARSADREGNRRAWLVRAFGSADVGSLPQRGFSGRYRERNGNEDAEIVFQTRLLVGEQRVTRRLHLTRDDRSRIIAELSTAGGRERTAIDTAVVADSVTVFGADYLVEYGANARWVREWISPVSAPVAVRLRITYMNEHADTMLLHIGPRG